MELKRRQSLKLKISYLNQLISSQLQLEKQHGTLIETDAKYRFERGIDPSSVLQGLEVATDLILKICGGQASKFIVTGKNSQKKSN